MFSARPRYNMHGRDLYPNLKMLPSFVSIAYIINYTDNAINTTHSPYVVWWASIGQRLVQCSVFAPTSVCYARFRVVYLWGIFLAGGHYKLVLRIPMQYLLIVGCAAKLNNHTVSRRFSRTSYSRPKPSKHGKFTLCCFNVGPPSSTLAQHWNTIGWMPLVCWV